MRCREPPGNTLNGVKAVAFLALFHMPRAPTAVLYLDADAWFSDAAFSDAAASPEAYLDLSDAEIVGNQNRVGGPRIPMNGGLLLARNSQFARDFFALWWRSRCGAHDQLPLWATVFAAAASATDERYAFDASIFSTYASAHGGAVAALMRDAAAIRRYGNVQGGSDGGTFSRTGLLDAPLLLPRIFFLPSAAYGGLPAIRSDADGTRPTFACHTRRGKVELEGQCDGSRVCLDGKCAPYADGPVDFHKTSLLDAFRTGPGLALLILVLVFPHAVILARRPDLRGRLRRYLRL